MISYGVNLFFQKVETLQLLINKILYIWRGRSCFVSKIMQGCDVNKIRHLTKDLKRCRFSMMQEVLYVNL